MKKNLKKNLVPLSVGKYLNFVSFFNRKKAANKAFSIFCTPRKGKLQSHQKEFLETAIQQELLFQDEKIKLYHWKGKGKKVLLVHGWESNSYRWRKLILELQKKEYYVIAFDAPAHGASSGKEINILFYAECLQKIIEEHEPFVLIGHSIGGMTCIFNQYNFNNKKIEKLVALGTASEMVGMMKNYQDLLKLKPKMMHELESFFKSNFGFSFKDFSAAKFAKDFTIPGLLIHDKEDKIVPFQASEAINKNWKNSELVITQGFGHSLQTSEVNFRIIEFLEK